MSNENKKPEYKCGDVVLEKIFKNVNEWLSFAEKKNTTILSVFGFITVFSALNYVKEFNSAAVLMKVGAGIYLLSYVIVLISSVISLMPVTDIQKKLIEGDKDKKIKDSDNLWFYGDIIKYNFAEYKVALSKNEVGCFSKIYEQLICQIIVNSHIASKKYMCFKVSSRSMAIGVIVSIVCFLISICCKSVG